MSQSINKHILFETLPPPWDGGLSNDALGGQVTANHKLVVLDDDPTGTQTVNQIPVLTDWNVEQLHEEFANNLPCFYLLTNSRSLPTEQAKRLNLEIARNLKVAAGDQYSFTVISRSDSTLRGHYPAETNVLDEALGPFTATLLIPFFEAGGRFTINDTHYVQQGDELIPASDTPFAKDSVFGYLNSDLKAWVEEKTKGKIKYSDVCSISLDCIRSRGPEGVRRELTNIKPGSVCIINAAEASDLDVVVTACKQVMSEERRFLFRTGAQWVSAWLHQKPHIIDLKPIINSKSRSGGLIVVGSYVPMTSRQLEQLRGQTNLVEIECSVNDLLDKAKAGKTLSKIIQRMNEALSKEQNVVVFTSRKLITEGSHAGDLDVGNQVSNALVHIVKNLQVQPRYLIAKGGITSSDVATLALGVKRAMVLGQAYPGIPVWELGPETNYPGMHYVVFPGNVGNDQTLLDIYQKFNP